MPGALWIFPKYNKDHEESYRTDHVISDPYYFTGFVEHLGLFTFQFT